MSQEGSKLFGVPIEVLRYAIYEAMNYRGMDWFLELQEEELEELQAIIYLHSEFKQNQEEKT